jgi:hypothetical protein
LRKEPFVEAVAWAVVGGLKVLIARFLGCRLAGAGLIVELELFRLEALCTSWLVQVIVIAVVPPIRVADLGIDIVLGSVCVPSVGVEVPAIMWLLDSASLIKLIEELLDVTKV